MDAHDWDARYAGDELTWGAAADPTVVAVATALTAGRALDLGCGEGRNALWLANRGWRVTAVDFSTVALTKGHRAAAHSPRSVRDRVDWVRADVTQVELPPNYDLVLLTYLHLPRSPRRALLRRASAALAPGGTLLLLGHAAVAHAHFPVEPETLCLPEELTEDLDGTGLRVVATPQGGGDDAGVATDLVVIATKPSLGS
ncbi:class I SAM-dependent methyltransferase [Rhodococcus tukisamuensis]|uniref:Methyltransferase domain-containing protein n=1 Tax=Rhodococcus tukisamuensis TaxID=168276 RepID=A0A1G6SQH9_9NOCA|nr:class I SAM-dependent methyltransferase [Rhodococcus tukisamuensis]SDD19068.1 Methyltransferase domain-containing protein [Rhodococcus tukisamuensis]